jgi:hypothetical protein
MNVGIDERCHGVAPSSMNQVVPRPLPVTKTLLSPAPHKFNTFNTFAIFVAVVPSTGARRERWGRRRLSCLSQTSVP